MNLQSNLTRLQHDRLGMFIHWGVYAMHGTNEWCQFYSKIPQEEYQYMVDHFDPDLFDPKDWARTAKSTGMKYVIFTTKHHDGFCMWDTQFTDYKITNTPFGRDALSEIVEAFREEGIAVGLYYSISDWHHPDFIIDKSHSLHHLPQPEIDRLNEGRDMSRYAQYMRDQVRELLTDFGEIVEFWFDVSGKIDPVACESQAMYDMIRELQPHIILNNRLALPGTENIITPENYLREEDCFDEEGNSVPWEGCHTLSASWCYNRDEKSYAKTPLRSLETIITQTSLNGNSLMNIGPTARGYISPLERRSLDLIAEWMKFNGRSIYGCKAAPSDFPPPPRDCRYTYNPELNRLYVHILHWPTGALLLRGLAGRVRYAQLLSDGSQMQIIKPGNLSNENLNPRFPKDAVPLRLMNPPECPSIPVIEVFLDQ